MTEYIDREKVLDEFYQCVLDGTITSVEDTGKFLRDFPAADVVPVVHGEWVVCGDGDNVPWMCSHCGKTTAHKYKVMYGKYCPNCGAHMKDGE